MVNEKAMPDAKRLRFANSLFVWILTSFTGETYLICCELVQTGLFDGAILRNGGCFKLQQ